MMSWSPDPGVVTLFSTSPLGVANSRSAYTFPPDLVNDKTVWVLICQRHFFEPSSLIISTLCILFPEMTSVSMGMRESRAPSSGSHVVLRWHVRKSWHHLGFAMIT